MPRGTLAATYAVYPAWIDERNSAIERTGIGETDIFTNVERRQRAVPAGAAATGRRPRQRAVRALTWAIHFLGIVLSAPDATLPGGGGRPRKFLAHPTRRSVFE
jgi:hypothetical protein